MHPNSYSPPQLSPGRMGGEPNPAASFGVTVNFYFRMTWEETIESMRLTPSSSEEGSAECPLSGSPSPLHFNLIFNFQLQDFPHLCKTSWTSSTHSTPPALGETLNLKVKIRGPFAPRKLDTNKPGVNRWAKTVSPD